jgi:AcrR family transcriptional regulator
MPNSLAATRARILDVTRARLADRSGDRISLRDLAAKADVSAARIVQCFGSKDELVFEARVLEVADNIRADVAHAMEHAEGFSQVEWFLRRYVERRLLTPWVTKDTHSTSWHWTRAQFTGFLSALEPANHMIKQACRKEWGLGETGFEPLFVEAATMARGVMVEALHEAIIFNQPASQVASSVVGATSAILDHTRRTIASRAALSTGD